MVSSPLRALWGVFSNGEWRAGICTTIILLGQAPEFYGESPPVQPRLKSLLPSRSERNRSLSPPLATAPACHAQSAGCAGAEERQVVRGRVNESATFRGGRQHSQRRSRLHRAQLFMTPLDSPQAPAAICYPRLLLTAIRTFILFLRTHPFARGTPHPIFAFPAPKTQPQFASPMSPREQ